MIAVVVEEEAYLLTATEKGLGRKAKIKNYPLQKRGGRDIISIKLLKKGEMKFGLSR